VGVYECKPAAGSEILEHQAFEEGGLPDAGLTDSVQVRKPVELMDTKWAKPPVKGGTA
jgi:hypothetical protein